jgi:ArsR family transcriptional regulator
MVTQTPVGSPGVYYERIAVRKQPSAASSALHQGLGLGEVLMKEIEAYFKGLADRNRLRIIGLLLHGELCGCDIRYVLDLPQPNVSRHLTYLKNCGLVSDRRSGFRVFYSLVEDQSAKKALFGYLRAVFKEDETFRGDAKRLRRAIANGACTVSESSLSTIAVPPKTHTRAQPPR